MRIHLLALPNVQTTPDYYLDGFATATIRFATLLKDMGHYVMLYASEENTAPCDELITCITKDEQQILLGKSEYQHAIQHPENPLWQLGNARAAREIGARKQSRDVICTIGGAAQQPCTDQHPDLLTIEYNIGYVGNFAKCRVFQSAAWQHYCYGHQNINEVRFFDTVIPAFFDPTVFPFHPDDKEPNLFVYVGRFIEKKGLKIVSQAAQAAGVRMVYVGHGTDTAHIQYGQILGPLPDDQRNELLSRAQAVLCPTTYVEPFNCVAVEAQLCGTPVISTDIGGFVETVEQGKTGFRCNYLGDFVDAFKKVQTLDPHYIRERAIREYSMDAAKVKFAAYFDRCNLLHDDGWNSLN